MLGNTSLLGSKDTEVGVCECCVSSYGSQKGKAASCLQKVHTNNPLGGLRSGRETPLLSAEFFFPISTHTDFEEDVLLRSKDSKGKMHDEATEPGVGACTYYLYAGVLRF